MRRWGVAFAVLATACAAPVRATDRVAADIAELTSEECAGRLVGTNGAYTAAAWVEREFEGAGLEVRRQEFPVPGREGARCFNVIGSIAGRSSGAIVVGAHYDHLGRGYPGADDNASGVAALLDLARTTPAGSITLSFAAFSGEEEGDLGSTAFVNDWPQRTVAMVNLDMVGRMRDRSVVISGADSGEGWRERIEHANTTGLHLVFDEGGLGPSDHAVFVARGISAIHITTGNHEDHHQPTDTADKLDLDGIVEIAGFVRRIVEDLATGPVPTFAHATTARSAGRFRVRFGTMPDYTFEGPGVRLQAVSDDGPAARAGLDSGDIVVSVAGVPMDDVQTYTDLLNELNPGVPVEVVYERGGQRSTTTLTPEAPHP